MNQVTDMSHDIETSEGLPSTWIHPQYVAEAPGRPRGTNWT